MAPAVLIVWQAVTTILVVAMVWDMWVLRRSEEIHVVRHCPPSLPLGVATEIRLTLTRHGSRRTRADVFDHYPTVTRMEGLPRRLVMDRDSQVDMNYTITPQRRGDIDFGRTEVVVQGPLGLMERRMFFGEGEQVKVYPNFQAVAGYAMLAAENRISQMGILKKRRRGEGMDFHQLRNYRVGDSMRQIDWKATSRLNKIISREYQEERDQQVVFLIDCGRRMMASGARLNHFDHTLNAALLLSYVAARQGDSVGLLTFGGEQRWIPPLKGSHSINIILNKIYDLQPSNVGADYFAAARHLITHLRKRALVIVISNLRDDDGADIAAAVRLLRRYHLVMFASLQETEVTEVLGDPVATFSDALRMASTHDYLNHRREAHRDLAAHKVVTLDVSPEDLSVQLVNKYLEIKSQQLL